MAKEISPQVAQTTLSIVLEFGESSTSKTIKFASPSDKTLNSLIQGLGLTLSKEQNLYLFNPSENDYHRLRTDKEVATLLHGAVIRVMTAKEKKLAAADRGKTEKKIEILVRQTTTMVFFCSINYARSPN